MGAAGGWALGKALSLFIPGKSPLIGILNETVEDGATSVGGAACNAITQAERQYIDAFVKGSYPPNYGVLNFGKPLSTAALRELSKELGGVEVAQIYVKEKVGGYYSTIYGTKAKISIPSFEGGTPYLINHVHPGGTTVPSAADKQLLEALQQIQKANGLPVQSSSQIVPIGNSNTKFNTTTKTTDAP